jgi:lipopolysaccharide/colanic/teichoic acid biosynthesis glycosyltransferase
VARRVFDIVGAGALLIITSPLLLAGAIAVRLDSSGPVIYRGVRVGRNGRRFAILKLRTMAWPQPSAGSSITLGNDPRSTRVGRVLRRTKLDELPQFINVLAGDMSLVGPRPEHPEWVEGYSAEQRRLLSVRPGVTSPASLAFADEERLLTGPDWRERYREVILPAKLAIELAYLDRRTLWSDLGVIARTALPRRSPPR